MVSGQSAFGRIAFLVFTCMIKVVFERDKLNLYYRVFVLVNLCQIWILRLNIFLIKNEINNAF
jgi:hypothetical protein